MMDSIFINALPVRTVIGVLPHEREYPQRLVLDVWLFTDIRPAARHEDLNLALNYAAMSVFIEQFAEQARFELLESFAEALCAQLLDRYPLCLGVQLSVTKPQALMQTAHIGVNITRMR